MAVLNARSAMRFFGDDAIVDDAGPVLKYCNSTLVELTAVVLCKTRSDAWPPRGERHQSKSNNAPLRLALRRESCDSMVLQTDVLDIKASSVLNHV
jgi:hypothetical protein